MPFHLQTLHPANTKVKETSPAETNEETVLSNLFPPSYLIFKSYTFILLSMVKINFEHAKN